MQCRTGQQIRISVRDDAGQHVLIADGETNLLGLLQNNNIAIGAVCGGGMICGTCHVFVRSANGEAPILAGEDEAALLELSDSYDPASSRLACQVALTEQLADCRIDVAPDE